MTGWWYTYPSEKYESQLGRIIPLPIYYGKIENVMKMFQTTNQMISTTQISISVVQHTQCDTLREWCVNNENTDKNHQTAVWGSLGRSSTQSGCSIFLKFHSKIPVRVPAILEPHGAGRKPSLSRC